MNDLAVLALQAVSTHASVRRRHPVFRVLFYKGGVSTHASVRRRPAVVTSVNDLATFQLTPP